MRTLTALIGISLVAAAGAVDAQAQSRLNPMISLQEAGQPVFGLYAPANRGARRGGPAAPQKSPAELAAETLGFERSDFVFNGSMEGGIDRGLPTWIDYVSALRGADANARTHPLVVKTVNIAENPGAAAGIGRQLDTGVSAVMFVGVESADEVRTGLEAMRFVENGGTRVARDVSQAAAYWGVSEAEYRRKADLWPLNPEGELINWTIIESHEGLANVREIAAVEGIGVLWPGAGTLRGLFSSRDSEGRRVLDEEAWEAAIQKVLSACKEFDIACGYPANASDIEERMAQGFSVFVMGWGDSGFATVDVGRQASGRAPS